MSRKTVLVCVCSMLALNSCGPETTALEYGPTAFTAVVAELLEDPAAPGTISRVLVLHPGQPEPSDRSLVHISSETTIVRRSAAGAMVPATAADIRVGQTARFRIGNTELRSYPRQVGATLIEL